jgi:hypothetical protein
MNIDIFSLLQLRFLITRIVLIATIMGFSYAAIADDVVTDDQIKRVAKIAKATGTTITIVKERVTVTVHGASKKARIKAEKLATKTLKKKPTRSRSRSYSSFSDSEPKPIQFASSGTPKHSLPRLDDNEVPNTSATPPSLENSPPSLEMTQESAAM